MTLRRLAWTVAAVAVCSTVISSQAPSGHALFEQALAKERVEGNLPEAIKLYERVVAEFASDRALAAQALVQVGLCYEKLGRDEAVRAYERLVRDFADQEDAVEQARVRLAVLRRPAPGAAAAGTMPVVRSFPRAVLSLSPDGTEPYRLRRGEPADDSPHRFRLHRWFFPRVRPSLVARRPPHRLRAVSQRRPGGLLRVAGDYALW
jgi:tetratricopeptide (TPR) repeat protein